ncbi:large ribosomal subunit protein bL19m [Trichomonascus vanleenenianus]|uniref:mitochondrial 54S ribosomal protein bL19m IMG1 n=1 Tax=Trichomonascus vanleenenianus TaxID=2268995 RepID=UPI003EC96AEB
MLQSLISRRGLPRTAALGQVRTFIIPVKKTNVIDVYKQTARAIPRGTTAVLETEKHLMAKYDPTGEKQKFIARSSPQSVKPGDIVRVRKKDGSSFVGMNMGVSRSSVGSTITLRNQILGTAVEMVYNVFSPEITSLEILRHPVKAKKKAKLYYLRGNIQHDVGDIDAELRRAERRRK